MNWHDRIRQLVQAAGLSARFAENLVDQALPEGDERAVLAAIRYEASLKTTHAELPELLTRQAMIRPDTFDADRGTFQCSWASEQPIPRTNGVGGFFEGLPWGTQFDEVLGLRPSEVNMEWMRSGRAPFLRDHGLRTKGLFITILPLLEDILGVVRRTSFEGAAADKIALANVELAHRETEEMASIRADMAAGILTNISAGYKVHQYRDITPRPTDENPEPKPRLRAVWWTPREITLGAVTADITSHTRSAPQPRTERCVVLLSGRNFRSDQEGTSMNWHDRIRQAVRNAGLSDTFAETLLQRIAENDTGALDAAIQAEVARGRTEPNTPATPAPTPAPATPQPAATPVTPAPAVRTEPAPTPAPAPAPTPAATPPPTPAETPQQMEARVRQELQERTTSIRSSVQRAGLPSEFADELIADQALDADGAAHRVLDRLATDSGRTQLRPQVAVTREGELQVRTMVENIVQHRARITDGEGQRIPITAGAQPFSNYSMMRLGEELLVAQGAARSEIGRMGKMHLAAAIFGMTGARIQGMHGTSDFPKIVLDAANRRLQSAYQAAPQTWRAFTNVVSVSDFKTRHNIALGEAPSLEEVNEHGEFRYGTLSDAEETYKLKTVGKIIAFTREALINDDTRAFDRMPRLWAAAAARYESDTVWALITGNVAMGDGNNLFSAAHANDFTVALSLASLSTARLKLRTQKGRDGVEHLNLTPRWLVGPPSLETTIDQLISEVQKVTVSNSGEPFVNPFAGGLSKIIENRLEDASSTAWYLFGDQSEAEMAEAAFLEGEDGPDIESEVSLDVNGMKMRVRHDFAAGMNDHRSMVRSDGTT